jgi:hypothetical protein
LRFAVGRPSGHRGADAGFMLSLAFR